MKGYHAPSEYAYSTDEAWDGRKDPERIRAPKGHRTRKGPSAFKSRPGGRSGPVTVSKWEPKEA